MRSISNRIKRLPDNLTHFIPDSHFIADRQPARCAKLGMDQIAIADLMLET